MALHDSIREYYFDHLTDLPADKQFHFASRLAAWEANPAAKQVLEHLRPHYVPEFPADGVLRDALQDVLANPPEGKLNAPAARAPYFERYPKLRAIDFVLFRVRHWLAIYDVDGRDALFNALPEAELTTLERKLLRDPKAMRALSTYAVNFIYLYERIMLDQDDKKAINLKAFYKLGKGYDLAQAEQIQLCIYLYTHCIIGDTNFYAHPVPDFGVRLYRKMLKRLETIITKNYDYVNLDNKLEFLVCCRICDYKTKLFERIEAECQQSVSETGTFIVDRHNKHAQSNKTSFADSEHRNVLYIMSQTPFKPPLE